MLNKKLLKWFIPYWVGLGLTSQALAYTVQDAVAHAVKTGPDVLISANNREAVEEDLRASFGGYLPSLNLNAGWGRENSNNASTVSAGVGEDLTLWRTEFGLNLRQMLFDGFAVKNDVEGNMARLRAESWRTNSTAQDLGLNVVTIYLQVLVEKELVALARDNLSAHQKIYGQIEQRSEGGVGRKADLEQALGRLAFARTNLMAEQANLRDAETHYLRLVGIPAMDLVLPEAPVAGFPETLRSAIAIAVNNHPQLRAAVADVSVSRAAHRAAKAPFYPALHFDLGYNHNRNVDGIIGPNDDFIGMLRVTWNLFQGGSDLARVRETAWKVEQAKEVRNRAHREVEEAIRLAWSTFTTAENQIRYFKEHVDAAIRTRDAYYQQFNIGQRTLLDVLESENELYGSRAALVRGKNQAILGKFRVLGSAGSLLDYLGVPLPRAARLDEPSMFNYKSFHTDYYDQYDRSQYHPKEEVLPTYTSTAKFKDGK